MTEPCGCGSNLKTTAIAQQDQTAECPATVHETVCVQADVTITPHVVVGEIKSFCRTGPFIGACPGTPAPHGTCTFTVSQNICVEVPLTFSATAEAVPSGIVCGEPATGHCEQVPPGFTCCEFIMATQGTTADGTPLPSLSIQLCGPAGQCSPFGNHISVEFPASGPNFEINLAEMISMQCNSPEPGLITLTARAIFNNGAGNSELANFVFIFNPANNTVQITATSVATGATLLNTTITLTGNVQFAPCTPQ